MTISISALEFGGAVTIGLLASTHCLAMCGGVNAAFGMSTSGRQPLLVSLFSLGRVACYGVLGVVIGGLSQWLGEHYFAAMQVMRVLAGAMLIAIAGYIGGWWLGLRRLEAVGQHLWRRVAPLAQRFVPIRKPQHALLLGALWGFLPCGLIYSTLLWASLQGGSALHSGLLMVGFGLGTLPAMVGIGLLGQRGKQLLGQRRFRRGASVLLLLFGLWTIAGATLMPHGDAHGSAPSHIHH